MQSGQDFSGAEARSKDSGKWAKVALGTLAAGGALMGMVGCEAQTAVAGEEIILHDQRHYDTMEFNLSREESGDVVVAFDQGDRVFNPTHNEVYDAPRAAFEANYQRGESLCKQAADLGGHCVNSNLAFIPNGEHGTIQVEQVGPGTINIGASQMTRSPGGVLIDGPAQDVYLGDNGLVNVF